MSEFEVTATVFHDGLFCDQDECPFMSIRYRTYYCNLPSVDCSVRLSKNFNGTIDRIPECIAAEIESTK